MPYDVYGVGNALVDIQASVSDEVLEQLDYAKGIMTLVDDDTQQKVLETLGDVDTYRCAGGSAANTIMGIADFGGSSGVLRQGRRGRNRGVFPEGHAATGSDH